MKVVDLFIGVLVVACIWTRPVYADPHDSSTPVSAEQEEVSLELLEFLGEFETEDGEWIDPEELEQMNINDNKKNEHETAEKDRD